MIFAVDKLYYKNNTPLQDYLDLHKVIRHSEIQLKGIHCSWALTSYARPIALGPCT